MCIMKERNYKPSNLLSTITYASVNPSTSSTICAEMMHLKMKQMQQWSSKDLRRPRLDKVKLRQV